MNPSIHTYRPQSITVNDFEGYVLKLVRQTEFWYISVKNNLYFYMELKHNFIKFLGNISPYKQSLHNVKYIFNSGLQFLF